MNVQEEIERLLGREIEYDKTFLTEEIDREIPRHLIIFHQCCKCEDIFYDFAAFPDVDIDLLRQAFYVLIETLSKVELPCRECEYDETRFLGYAMVFMGWYVFSKLHPDELLKDGPVSELPNKKEAYCAVLSTMEGVKIHCYEILRFEHHTEVKLAKKHEKKFAEQASGSFVVDIKKLLGGEKKDA